MGFCVELQTISHTHYMICLKNNVEDVTMKEAQYHWTLLTIHRKWPKKRGFPQVKKRPTATEIHQPRNTSSSLRLNYTVGHHKWMYNGEHTHQRLEHPVLPVFLSSAIAMPNL